MSAAIPVTTLSLKGLPCAVSQGTIVSSFHSRATHGHQPLAADPAPGWLITGNNRRLLVWWCASATKRKEQGCDFRDVGLLQLATAVPLLSEFQGSGCTRGLGRKTNCRLFCDSQGLAE